MNQSNILIFLSQSRLNMTDSNVIVNVIMLIVVVFKYFIVRIRNQSSFKCTFRRICRPFRLIILLWHNNDNIINNLAPKSTISFIHIMRACANGNRTWYNSSTTIYAHTHTDIILLLHSWCKTVSVMCQIIMNITVVNALSLSESFFLSASTSPLALYS